MKRVLPLLVAATFATCAVQAAQAQDDNWVLRFGAHVVAPKSHNGNLAGMQASIDNDTKPTASIEYLLTPNWGFDALAAVPFEHDVKLNGQLAASTKDLPPVLGVNYHFLPDSRVSPFVGAGVNYTRFFDTKGKDLLAGAKVKIDDSWGPAAHAGLDVTLSPRWLFTADVRWISIRGDVHVNGANVGRAQVDPWVYGLSLGYRF